MIDHVKAQLTRTVVQRLTSGERSDLNWQRIERAAKLLLSTVVIVAVSLFVGFSLSAHNTIAHTLGWNVGIVLMAAEIMICAYAGLYYPTISGPLPSLPVSDSVVLRSHLHAHLGPLSLSLIAISVPLIVLGLQCGYAIHVALLAGISLALIEYSIIVLIIAPFAFYDRLPCQLCARPLVNTLAYALILALFTPSSIARHLSGLVLVSSWCVPPSWPALFVHRHPEQLMLISIAGAAVLVPTASICLWRFAGLFLKQFEVIEYLQVDDSESRFPSHFAVVKRSFDSACKGVDEFPRCEPVGSEPSAGDFQTHIAPGLAAAEAVTCEDPAAEYERTPVAYFRFEHQRREESRHRARAWYRRWGMSPDEIRLMEIVRAKPLAEFRIGPLWYLAMVTPLVILFAPEPLPFAVGVVLVFCAMNALESSKYFSRAAWFPLDCRVLLLAEVKYRYLRCLPWIVPGLFLFMAFGIREEIAAIELIAYFVRVAILFVLVLPCWLVLDFAGQLHRRWASWATVYWLLVFLLGIGLSLAGAGLLWVENWKVVLAAAIACGLGTWYLWSACVRYFEVGGTDVR